MYPVSGIANITVLEPGSAVLAHDVGPANALIDAADALDGEDGTMFDAGGCRAAAGAIDQALLARLLAEPYYRLAPPKTTGKETFNAAYLAERAGDVSGADLIATVTALTAEVVAAAVRSHHAQRVLVSGDGLHNETLMRWLAERLPGVAIAPTDAVGLPVNAKEAIALALIGWLTAHGLSGSVATATGAGSDRVLGAITPGRGALRLPLPANMPRLLVMNGAAC